MRYEVDDIFWFFCNLWESMRGKVIFISVHDITWKMVQRPGATRSSSGLERENLYHEKNGRYTCTSWISKIEEENERTFEQPIHSIIAWCQCQAVAPFNIITTYLLSLGKNARNWIEKGKARQRRQGWRQKAYRMWKKTKEENRTKEEVDYSFANCCTLLLQIVLK